MWEAVKITVITVLVFGVLIFVHELGHFIACRIFGIRVNEFAIGMGPKLLSRQSKKSGTVYSVRAFPIGGFNNIEYGSVETTDAEGNEILYHPPREELPDYALGAKPVWQRMIVMVAGALMNLILGLIIMTVIVISTEKYGSTTVAYFLDTETGEQIQEYSGLMAGDKIVKVGGRRVFTGDELVYSIFAKGADPVDVTVIRDGNKKMIEDVSFPTQEKQGITFGIINFRIYSEEKNFVNTVKQSFFGSVNVVTQVVDSLVGIFTGKYGLEHMSGPIGVGEVIGQAAKYGLRSVMTITVMLSMNLGVFNLLPVPGLDGGKIVFLIIEWIRRKPIPTKIEENATIVGITLLFALGIVIAFKDTFAMIFR